MYGARSQGGYEFKMLDKEFYIVEEIQNEIKVSKFSCLREPCQNQTFNPSNTGIPDLYFDFIKRLIAIKSSIS
jgi:hypothetical protein